MAEDNSIPIIARKEASEQHLPRYFTGKPCKHNHIAERLTINGGCVECSAISQRQRYHERREENLAYQKERRDNDPMLAIKRLARNIRNDPGLAERIINRQDEDANHAKAQCNGERMYVSGRSCEKDHQPIRFVSDRKCVECNRLMCLMHSPWHARVLLDPKLLAIEQLAKSLKQLSRQRLNTIKQVKRDFRDKRKIAQVEGSVTYIGRNCSFHNAGVRYTSTGACIECMAEYSASQKKKEYDKKYFSENREKIIERTRIYYENSDKSVRNLQSIRWVKANPEKRKAIARADKSRRRQICDGGDSTSIIYAWEKAEPKVCWWCDKDCSDAYHVDHFYTLSKGGVDEVWNLDISCPSCNLRKLAKDPFVFLRQIGKLMLIQKHKHKP